MAVAEPGFIVNHPISPGPVLGGHAGQRHTDCGSARRVWRSAVRNGDAGGVAFDPGAPGRFVAQTIQSTWTDDGGQAVHADVPARVQRRVGIPASRKARRRSTRMPQSRSTGARDSGHAAGSRHRPGVVQRAVGPRPLGRRRVATPVGDTADDAPTRGPGTPRRRLRRTRSPRISSRRALRRGRRPGRRPGIRVLRWQSPTVLLAVTEGAVHSLTDPGGPGAWAAGAGRHPPAGPGRGPAGRRSRPPSRGPACPAYGELQRPRSRPDSARGVLSRDRPSARAVVVVGRRALPSDDARDAARTGPVRPPIASSSTRRRRRSSTPAPRSASGRGR